MMYQIEIMHGISIILHVLMKEKFIAKKKEQDKASGIDVEVTEIDVLLEEIIDKEKYYELECKDKDEEHERKI